MKTVKELEAELVEAKARETAEEKARIEAWEKTLKPCPFCGCVRIHRLELHRVPFSHRIWCSRENCGAFLKTTGWTFANEEEAWETLRKRWNRRLAPKVQKRPAQEVQP